MNRPPQAGGPAQLLVVDDDPEMSELLAEILEDEGYSARTAGSAKEALWMLQSVPFHVVITDLRMKGMSGMELLTDIHTTYPQVEVIMITAFGTVDTAIEAIRAGAYDYITKPFKTDQILAVVHRAVEKVGLQTQVARLSGSEEMEFHGIVGVDPAMRQVFEYVRRVAGSPANVLIVGESGTGKDLIARAIHRESGCAGALVPVNCAAIPDTLMEGEFFGAKKGAYTDAKEDRAGLFEQAADGTLFLDEVAEIPLPLQGKLLRVLQDHKVRRLGDQREVAVTARIVSATNRDLAQMVAEGNFREDLYYRLNVIPIQLPPLRERAMDIPLLVAHVVRRLCEENHRSAMTISDGAMARLSRYPWPGNVRELANVLERAVILAQGDLLTQHDLPESLGMGTDEAAEAPPTDDLATGGQTLAEVERAYILRVLAESDDNRTVAAQRLGIDRKTLYRKLERYGMEP